MAQAKQILLVDDQADAIDALAMLLELDGHQVRTAYSGAGALAIVDGFIPDLALIDVSMPDMSGMDLARLLRQNQALARTRLVALTGFSDEANKRQATDAGFDAHVVKPLSADQLASLIANASDAPAP
ncbi:response regulator [Paraburkholderia sp. DHOC27]|uniref:response regulator n=1 Tax=Paraburkholderia sp. DHOC27 TaxID=2303330 RepID=UPI000E3E56B0|nr:response regulator [Paraburkholderia sp. DHOC27]RFU46952.1 response regulator [Paraburkholderia sp. DHOC27]